VDWLTSSVTWVEQGKLPTNVIASETAADSASGGFASNRGSNGNNEIVKTRPIFPPMQARYNRKGSVDDANFVGVMPSQASDDRVNWIGNDYFS